MGKVCNSELIYQQDPLISIIVPVYNAEKYIEYCVKSILRQTYKNFELILVDDGSQDNSLALCTMFASKDHRIKVYNQLNGGASAARNRGLQVADGSYIVFIDSDDYVSDNYIENMYLAAVLGPYDIVQCELKRTSEQMEKVPSVSFRKTDVQEITKEQALNARLYKVSVWGKIYSAHILKDFLFKEGIIFEDDASYYLLIDRAVRLALLDETLYYYYMSDNSVMRNTNREKSTVFVDIYEDRIGYFIEKNDQVLLDGTYSRFCLVLMLKISCGQAQGYNKSDINWFIELFNQYYPKVREAKNIRWKDKLMFACFNMSPKCVGRIIGLLRKRN